jgi:hypothetical protein
MNPTSWNFNPTASTSNVVEYDSATRKYDVSTQPYDGYAVGTNPYNWKNPTAYTNSLVYPAEQQYYGGPSYVPLYGGPTNWVANAGIVNQSGQYVPSQGADANLREYNGSSTPYDSANFDYDGTNNGESFDNWKTATAWTPIAGGNDF